MKKDEIINLEAMEDFDYIPDTESSDVIENENEHTDTVSSVLIPLVLMIFALIIATAH